MQRDRHPQLDRIVKHGEMKPRGHHSDYREWQAIENQSATDHLLVAVKTTLPQIVAQKSPDARRFRRRIVLHWAGNCAPELGTHTTQ